MRRLGILEKDIEEHFVRSSGAGGQNVNKVSTCVVLKHVPTAIEVKCQMERSQAINRFLARRILTDKIEKMTLGRKSEAEKQRWKIRKQKRRRSRRAKEKVLKEKHHQAEKKKLRGMVKYFLIALVIGGALTYGTSSALCAEEHRLSEHFEVAGFLSAGMGWQRFAGATPTEAANDHSFAGVIGSVIPEVATGGMPSEGEDDTEAFMEALELDIIANLSDRARLRTDILFGRATSGSWVAAPGVELEQAYASMTLSERYNIQLTMGRIGTVVGLEPFEPYNNDTISWSIISRANLYPTIVTGAQISANITDNIDVYLIMANGLTNDTDVKINDAPAGVGSFVLTWGPEDRENILVISPYVGPESGSNRHLTFGIDATIMAPISPDISIGGEALYRRDNGAGGPYTEYAAALLNVKWAIADDLYGVIRYSYAQQFDVGNGVLNLTGGKQQIHEASIGGGYQLTDGVKFKVETRLDVIDPSVGGVQWVPGVAMALACAF